MAPAAAAGAGRGGAVEHGLQPRGEGNWHGQRILLLWRLATWIAGMKSRCSDFTMYLKQTVTIFQRVNAASAAEQGTGRSRGQGGAGDREVT